MTLVEQIGQASKTGSFILLAGVCVWSGYNMIYDTYKTNRSSSEEFNDGLKITYRTFGGLLISLGVETLSKACL